LPIPAPLLRQNCTSKIEDVYQKKDKLEEKITIIVVNNLVQIVNDYFLLDVESLLIIVVQTLSIYPKTLLGVALYAH
jgi:hypothetical protein